MNFILASIIVLGSIALFAAIILYLVSVKFAVNEDPRLGKVATALPGANCGGCGFPGCSAMADALVKGADNGSIDGLVCPVGGKKVMTEISDILGMSIEEGDPMVAVVRCNGSCEMREHTINYEGLHTCVAVSATCSGETLCGYGCLGCGDCVEVCNFDAIHINANTGLPEVDDEQCVACGNCVKACPRNIIEIRKRGVKNKRLYVSCMNKDRGAVSMKACKAACIGCGKCLKECKFDAIVIENNLSYIDFRKCKMCRKCEMVCPTKAIVSINFPKRSAETTIIKEETKA